MRRHIVAAQLLRVESALTLTHPLPGRTPPDRTTWHNRTERDHRAPAVLVIPRGGSPREPHLVTLRSPGGAWDAAGVVTDTHAIAWADELPGCSYRATADVLVWRGRASAAELASLLADHPGSGIAAGRRAGGCLLRLPDGTTVDVDGPQPPGVYGSVLHCWLAAGMPIKALADAALAAGHYSAGHFSVTGRAALRIRRDRAPATPPCAA